MATTATAYYPFDAGAGANIQEAQWRTMQGLIHSSGVIKGYLNELAVTGDSTGMQVKLATGGAWIYGAYGENTSGVQTISIAASHATLNRYDLIVARNNYTTNVVEFDVIQGTNGASPTVPTVTIDTTKYEIALAYVYIAATVTTITAANVTDQRQYNMENNAIFRRFVLATAGDTITVDNLPARKYLTVFASLLNTGGTISATVRFNNDSGANYARRLSTNNSADSATGSLTSLVLSSSLAAPCFLVMDIMNIAAQEKYLQSQATAATSGAGNAPQRDESHSKWANTSTQISRIDLINVGTGDYAIGSEVVVIGHD